LCESTEAELPNTTILQLSSDNPTYVYSKLYQLQRKPFFPVCYSVHNQ